MMRFCLAAALLAWSGPWLMFESRTFAETNVAPWLRLAWSSDDGLPNNTVVGLAQTSDGFLWLGTPNGLARFDGFQFEAFSSTNFIAPPNRGILALAAGRGGRLHLGMDRGAIVTLDSGRATVFLPDTKVSLLTIYSMVEDAQGALWVCYRDGSVGRLEGDKLVRFLGDHGLPAGSDICSMACDAKGRLWFIKAGHLGLWRNGEFETLKLLPPGPARLAAARRDGLWLCAGFHLYRVTEQGGLEDRGSFQPRLPGTEPSILLESRDGAVWIGTSFSGLLRWQDGNFESVPTTHPDLLALAEDAEGNLWAGTAGGGLNQVRPRAMSLESSEGELSLQGVQSLSQDTQGVVWAAMRNGALARWVAGHWQMIPTDGNWTGDAICVCADASGNVWVGTRYHRLLCWRDTPSGAGRDAGAPSGGGFVRWGDVQQIKGQTVHTLVVATNGDLWLGEDTPGTVQRLRQGKLDDFAVPPDSRVIRASVQDAAGRIWFGTSKGILLRTEGDRLVDETARTTGEPQSIRGLCATPDGSLWIAYAGWGLGRLKAGHFAQIGARQGLYDDFLSQIIPDERGWLWFGANRGLFKVRQEELDSVADGRLARVRSVHYGSGEYGQGEERFSLQANFGNAPLALRSRDQRLWFPMRTGLVVVDPCRLPEQSKPPTVLVTRVKAGENVLAAYGGLVPSRSTEHPEGWTPNGALELAQAKRILRIPPNHRRLQIEFTALNFAGAENNFFRYQLEGMDEDWTGTSERNAVYPRLPAGEYQFHVMACNSEGIWNETGASLAIVVTPFFWQTWWFRTVAMALFAAILIAVVRYTSFRRLRSQLRHFEAQAALQGERARIAKDIHDDVGASLTQISLLAELARGEAALPDKAGQQIGKMSETARRAVRSLDEIVWAVNPRNDTLEHFIDYTGQYALDYLRPAGIRCRLDLPEEVPPRELSTDVRHNLFLVVKEAITNCVKHAQATELRLQVTLSEEKLAIVVQDNGRGFEPPPENATADGLRNMRQRLADIGGKCSIQSRPGAGASVCLEVPWSALRSRT